MSQTVSSPLTVRARGWLALVLSAMLVTLGVLPTVSWAYGENGGYAANGANGGDAMQSSQPQDFSLVEQAAKSYLMQQTEGLPGEVTVSLTPAAPRGLASCPALEPFIPPGVRLWGRAMVGVRCNGERPWTIYLQARIGVVGDYYVAARNINAGDTISMDDLSMQHGDLTALPATLITNPTQAVGGIAMNRMTAGLPVRSDMIRTAMAIRFGQEVKVVAQGAGFSVSSEGSALSNATPGQSIRVKTASGTIISGVVQPDSSVIVPL